MIRSINRLQDKLKSGFSMATVVVFVLFAGFLFAAVIISFSSERNEKTTSKNNSSSNSEVNSNPSMIFGEDEDEEVEEKKYYDYICNGNCVKNTKKLKTKKARKFAEEFLCENIDVEYNIFLNADDVNYEAQRKLKPEEFEGVAEYEFRDRLDKFCKGNIHHDFVGGEVKPIQICRGDPAISNIYCFELGQKKKYYR